MENIAYFKTCSKCKKLKDKQDFNNCKSTKDGKNYSCKECVKDSRKKSDLCGIYKITSPSGRVYIGQSVDIEIRFKKYKRLSCKKQIRLHNSLKKYGAENHIFEVVEECSEEDLNCRERYWQDFYDVLTKKGLNCQLTKTHDKSGKLSKTTINNSKNRYGNELKMRDVINLEVGVFYESINEASRYSGIGLSTFSDMIKGKYSNKTPYILCDDYEKGLSPGKLFKPKESRKTSTKTKLINPETGKIYNTIKEFSVDFGISYDTALNLFNGRSKTNISPVIKLEDYNKINSL